MPCDPLINPACIITKVIAPVTGAVTGGILGGIAQAIDEGIRWIVVNTATWWVQIPSPNLATEPAVTRIQAWLLPITVAIGIGGVVAAGLRMALTRRAIPLLDVSSGLLALAAAITLGVIVPTLLLKAGDAWSSWVLQASTGGHFTQRLSGILQLGGNAAPAVVLILGLVAIVLALVQAVLMLFRQVALVILAGVLPLAAAGAVAPLTRPWIRKISSWMLALICYKPAAAAAAARRVRPRPASAEARPAAAPALSSAGPGLSGAPGTPPAYASPAGGGPPGAASASAGSAPAATGTTEASAGSASAGAAATGAAAAAGPAGQAAAAAVQAAKTTVGTTVRAAGGAMGPEGERR